MFKVGDWVKIGSTVQQIIAINPENDYNITEDMIETKDDYVSIGSVELWKPQPGEWCWFWDDYGNNLLSRFVKISKKGNYKSDENVLKYNKYNIIKLSNKWKYCEPFTGELPSFIKN